MQTLEGLGWTWRENGVIVCVQIDGKKMQVFLPLSRVWHEFHKELAAVGCPLPASVGGEQTVSGLFSSIAHAVSHAASSATHAISKAASTVVKDAKSVATHAASAVTKIPVIGPLAKAVNHLASTPLAMTEALARGGRIDRVALGALKSNLADVKTIAPYVQTVVSFVPGVGQGLSGAIGAATALASGHSITDAMTAAVKGALPGGPLAQAAFEVAHGVMQGKPIDQIALNALPISAAQKQALTQGISAAKELAAGKNVSQIAIDQALHALPANLQKAVQIGAALGHAKSIQAAAGVLAKAGVAASPMAKAAAAEIAAAHAAGIAAALHINSLPANVKPPAHLVAALHKGLRAKAQLNQAIAQAQAGHPASAQIVGAFLGHTNTAPLGGTGHFFRPRYHTTPATAPTATVGSPFGALAHRAVQLRHAASTTTHTARLPISGTFLAHVHHHARNGGHRSAFMAKPRSVFAAHR